MKNKFLSKQKLVIALNCFFAINIFSQNLTQTIRGKVIDIDSKISIPGVNIIILGTNPLIGTSTDVDGNYKIEKVPVGRYNIQISSIGYNSVIKSEVLVNTGKEVILNVEIKESVISMKEVEIRAKTDKSNAINPMATISARSFSVEETRRYAGSADDPLRAASSFAGVASSSSVQNNEIIVRGNSPKGLLWRLEGVDIPNPNHFGQVGQSGGGVTIFSSQLLANSDFYTAAFPAEYGNSLAGVFDMKFRNGNNQKREYTFQIGIQGIDFSTEGPFNKGNQSSYLINYRYSTLGILRLILSDLKDKLPTYQDLSFKINLPTKKAGTFSIMCISGLGLSSYKPSKDSADWKLKENIQESTLNTTMGAVAVSNHYNLSKKTYIHSTFAVTGNNVLWKNGILNSSHIIQKTDEVSYINYKLSASTYINHKFNAKHTIKSGITINKLKYDINIKALNFFNGQFMNFVDENGSTNLIQAFSQIKSDLTEKVILNYGINYQYFTLNSNYSVEPRISLKYNFVGNQSFSIGYGNHSQIENINIYLATKQVALNQYVRPNKNLDFSKANHFVVGYDINIAEDIRFKVEPYYQYLYNIPVIENSYYSMINNSGGYFNDSLVNKGTGKNYGIDFTFEKFLSKDYYYLLTASFYQSKYKGGDNIERNCRFNNNYVINFLIGKEFKIKDKNIIGLNLKSAFSGGEYYVPIDLNKSIIENREILNESIAYTKKLKDFYYLDFTVTYRINHEKYSAVWALQAKNLLNQKPAVGYAYNPYLKKIDEDRSLGILPFLSYKIEF